MFRFAVLAVLIASCLADDASTHCFSVKSRRNQKDLYENTADCHKYYQCFFLNETFAVGIERRCPTGSFWHDAVLSCMPEGSTPCVDICMDKNIAAKGCYPGFGCRQYFTCSNTGSFGMCCPEGTQFNQATCGCDESATCHDPCHQQGPAVATTIAPPKKVSDKVCEDSYGSQISPVAGEPNAYYLVEADGSLSVKMYCPATLAFDIETCRCNEETGVTQPPSPAFHKAVLWATFDDLVVDHSLNHFPLFMYDGTDRDTSISAYGGASLAVNGGYIAIPGLKSYDHRSQFSWAGFFRCSGSCTGGVLSNNVDQAASDYTVILGLTGATTFQFRLKFADGTFKVGTASFQIPSNSWNHFALTYDGNTVRLYVNGAVAYTENYAGLLEISPAPYAVGNDQALGQFAGNIDDLLLAPFAMTQEEVNAHRSGDRNYLSTHGFF